MSRLKPLVITPEEIHSLEHYRRALRKIREGFGDLPKHHAVAMNLIQKLEPGNFEGRNYPDLLATLLLEAESHSRICGSIDNRLGETIHKIQKGEQNVVTKTVRKVEVGTRSTAEGKRKADVGERS